MIPSDNSERAPASVEEAVGRIHATFAEELHFEPVAVYAREYPDEVVFVVELADNVERGAQLGAKLDDRIRSWGMKGFVVLKKVQSALPRVPTKADIHSAAMTQLLSLITEHSRASEAAPPIEYVNLGVPAEDLAAARRDTVVFGRRGAGKTSLLLHARAQVESNGDLAHWCNLHAYSGIDMRRCFIQVIQEFLRQVQTWVSQRRPEGEGIRRVGDAILEVRRVLESGTFDSWREVIPYVNGALRVATTELGKALYVFLDDFYFLPPQDQPGFADAIYACKRDADCWIKIATIQHTSKLYIESPPLGIKLGHDAVEISLDVTLEEPSRARELLRRILEVFAERIGMGSVHRFASENVIDRLTMASAGVPRDFLMLFQQAVLIARGHGTKRRSVGVEDVNEAAGKLAGLREADLREDTSSFAEHAGRLTDLLKRIRLHCTELENKEQRYNYFLVDQAAATDADDAYSDLLQLLDLRFIHLLDRGISDQHRPLRRYQVYLLDVSQYTVKRLKRNLWVLDLHRDNFVLSWKGKGAARMQPFEATSLERRRDIFRRAQELSLTEA
jgi:hypothetical protein